ncbi:MAG: polysaccharide deacetylase family protein [Polyangiaceae bacterium]|nr:polysaccharide deacetylase family protein [Polyangiaceae bacterium]
MQRVLLSSALVIAGATLAACAPDATPTRTNERVASTAEPLSATQFNGTSLPPKTLALTIDDGISDRTSALSTYLKSEGIRVVFFVIGETIAKSPDLPYTNDPVPNASAILQQLVADGHLIGNHTTSHADATAVSSARLIQELTETDNDIAPYTQSNKLLFRAPMGNWNNPTTYNGVKDSAMNKYVGPIYWDIGGLSDQYPNAAADWACWQGQLNIGHATTTQCGDAYIKEITSVGKGIVLMHDPYFWAQGNTLAMLQYIVPKLKAQGYSFVRLDEVPDIKNALPPCNASCVTCSGPNANQCDSCSADKFLTAHTCTPCSTCAAGKFQTAACTATADTVCTACDATCATCTGPASTNCTTCGLGRYLNDGTCAVCTQCEAGNYTKTTCTATTDTVCAPCPEGTSASSAGATECTSCGDCEDGDECTADSCDAVLGCVHVTDDACEAAKKDAGTGSDSGGPTDDGGSNDGSTPSDSGVDSVTIDSGKSGGCNVGRASGGQGGVALGALAWLIARRKRASHS